jgi:hypothetical protein
MSRMKILGFCALALLCGIALSAAPAFAAEAPILKAPAAADQTGCAGTLNLDAVSGKGQVCSAATPQKTPEPEFMASKPVRLRTCVCSCGYPCTSDADCGGALGSCRSGISCC